MYNEKEYFFQCPYCFESISFLLEELYDNQNYIEDCEVCCNPIEINYRSNGEEIINFNAEKA
jgi:hypothetical protein